MAYDQTTADLLAENKKLRKALKDLLEASGHVSPFGNEVSVKAVRLAGEYVRAYEAAQAALTN